MIFVTGTKRSGTSLWMQILIGAGFPYIGEAYPKNWIESIKDANPEGFYESSFRRGVYYKTNPNPKTGSYLFPEKTRRHAIKVFIPGVIRSDRAFIDNVIGTIRPWREYVQSVRRLYTIEDEYLAGIPSTEGKISQLEYARLMRGELHPALEWWKENYDLLRNFITRRYPFNFVSYRKLLDAPEDVIPPVIHWCGGGDIERAIKVVNSSLNTQRNVTSVYDNPLTQKQEDIFDEFHRYCYEQQPMKKSFIESLNQADEELRPLIVDSCQKGLQRLQEYLRGTGLSEESVQEVSAAQADIQNEMGF